MPTTFPANTYPNTVVNTAGIVHYMRFGEASGTTTRDDADSLSGTLTNVTLGATGAIVGDTNDCFAFNGSSSRVDFGNTNALSGNFSVEVWIFPTVNYTSGFPTFLSKENYNSPVSGWSFYLQGRSAANGGMRAAFMRASNYTQYRVYSDPIPVNEWTHLVATYDGTTLRMYQNGVLKWDTPSPGSIFTSAYRFLAGCATNASSTYYSDFYAGRLDELAIYNTTLSATTINNHYQRALVAPVTNLYLSLSDSDGFVETETKTQTATMTRTDSDTLASTESRSITGFYTLSDSDTMTSVDTVDGIISEYGGDKLTMTPEDALLGETVTKTQEATMPLLDETTLLVDYNAFAINAIANTTTDARQIGATEAFAAYNTIDSRFHGKIHRERMGLLHRAVYQRFPHASQIQYPHNVTVRIGIPEDDYFVVLGNEGQFVALGRMTTTWDGPRLAARRTVEEDLYIAASNSHTTIEFFRDPTAHPEILALFDLPLQHVG